MTPRNLAAPRPSRISHRPRSTRPGFTTPLNPTNPAAPGRHPPPPQCYMLSPPPPPHRTHSATDSSQAYTQPSYRAPTDHWACRHEATGTRRFIPSWMDMRVLRPCDEPGVIVLGLRLRSRVCGPCGGFFCCELWERSKIARVFPALWAKRPPPRRQQP